MWNIFQPANDNLLWGVLKEAKAHIGKFRFERRRLKLVLLFCSTCVPFFVDYCDHAGKLIDLLLSTWSKHMRG